MDKLETLGIIVSFFAGAGGAVMAVLSYQLARDQRGRIREKGEVPAADHTVVLDGRSIDLGRLDSTERAQLISRLERAV